jgi:tetratricopeptide (TPR) repeat protein
MTGTEAVPAPSTPGGVRTRVLLASLVLAVLVALPYAQLRHHEFVHFDDYGYIVDNPRVTAGLTASGLAWAFTTHHMANWHPLTWISHMLDCQWFGLDPGPHHLMGAGLHLLNAILLFIVLWVMTGAMGPSLVVAALFAVHPLRVESVAWASERKDLLAALFWILTMLAWVAYVRRPGALRYLGVCASMVAGLLAKPMLVTLPAVLLLLDYWPLRRLAVPGVETGERYPVVSARIAILEKLPLLGLAVLSSVATLVAQSAGGAVQELVGLPLAARLGNAAVAYVTYLWKTIWPARLAVYYPHPAIVDPDGATAQLVVGIAAATLLLLATALALRFAKSAPHAAVGWLWFLFTLVPVIGIVQVGNQALADRYTYLPLVGIYLAVVWTGHEFANRRPRTRVALLAGSAIVVLALTAATSIQARTWRDSATLFRHAIRVTDDNYVAHVNLGNTFARAGELDSAEAQYREALRIEPDQVEALHNLGGILLQRGDPHGAAAKYRAAIRLRPDYTDAHLHLGIALDFTGATRAALGHYERAARLDPDSHRAQEHLAGALARIGEDAEAARRYRRALGLRPDSLEAAHSLAWLLSTSPDASVRDGREALALARRCAEALGFGDPYALATLAAASAESGLFEDAVRWQRRAVDLAPEGARDLFRDRLRLYLDGSPLREELDERAMDREIP